MICRFERGCSFEIWQRDRLDSIQEREQHQREPHQQVGHEMSDFPV